MALFNATKKVSATYFLDQTEPLWCLVYNSKVLPNPWGKTASATIIICQPLVQFLRGRHENSKYDISS